ncbi:PorT family protein [Adhaeribacter sp. BT258]|uniref:PorT family protein n=1 Tax=Adhaeribacter terrigena TaxID=2793070 RepID=A0ABS1C3I4_9BACT|nr:porin family protein [Adhaeribacter terrigena]MBK0403203.1 PorT family protein [Adhaeribacter terrigena]
MKALFTFLFLTFYVGAIAFAQSPEPTAEEPTKQIFGFRAGGNLSSISGNDLYLGYHAGFFTDMPFSKKYGFSVELNYARQGGTFQGTPIKMDYIVFPVLFNLYVSEVALQAGAYAAPLLSAQNAQDGYYNSTGNINNMDLGLAVGVKRALGTVGVGLRYYQGLQNVAGSGSKVVNHKLELSLRLNL